MRRWSEKMLRASIAKDTKMRKVERIPSGGNWIDRAEKKNRCRVEEWDGSCEINFVTMNKRWSDLSSRGQRARHHSPAASVCRKVTPSF